MMSIAWSEAEGGEGEWVEVEKVGGGFDNIQLVFSIILFVNIWQIWEIKSS